MARFEETLLGASWPVYRQEFDRSVGKLSFISEAARVLHLNPHLGAPVSKDFPFSRTGGCSCWLGGIALTGQAGTELVLTCYGYVPVQRKITKKAVGLS
jgi:hypothetical protein